MSQTAKLKELLLDTEPHNTLEIRSVVYGNEILNMARIAARINDLKKQGYTIRGWKENGQYWYQMMPAKTYESGDIAPIINKAEAEKSLYLSPDSYKALEEQIMARMLR